IPMNSRLTFELLKASEQVVQNENELILVYNISDQWDYYDPHLLFFNGSLKLYAACYFPSERIESVRENIIMAYKNERRYKRRSLYKNDLPKKYKLNLISSSDFNGSTREGNKIVDKIELDSVGSSAVLYILKSEDRYITVGVNSSNLDSAFLQNFTIHDTLEYRVSDLQLDYNNKYIQINKINNDNSLIKEKLMVSDNAILDQFYHQLFYKLNKNNNKYD
ncbi:MAG TPA: hypothetical protein PJ990_19230, partial [Saprospiraceae bacterium]|nr:hypothetical protein [Saprospiraceae bacterium]